MQQAALVASAKAASKTTAVDINANAAASSAFSAMALASSSRGRSPSVHKIHAVQVSDARNRTEVHRVWHQSCLH